MNQLLFAGRYVFHSDGPEGVADLLEQFAKSPKPDTACEVARLLVAAAQNGDSELFRKRGAWVDLAKGVKKRGVKPDSDAIDATIRQFLSMYEDKDPPVNPTAKDFTEILNGLGLKISESTVTARLRRLRGRSRPGRPKSATSWWSCRLGGGKRRTMACIVV